MHDCPSIAPLASSDDLDFENLDEKILQNDGDHKETVGESEEDSLGSVICNAEAEIPAAVERSAEGPPQIVHVHQLP
jgi:hypothetical protein